MKYSLLLKILMSTSVSGLLLIGFLNSGVGAGSPHTTFPPDPSSNPSPQNWSPVGSSQLFKWRKHSADVAEWRWNLYNYDVQQPKWICGTGIKPVGTDVNQLKCNGVPSSQGLLAYLEYRLNGQAWFRQDYHWFKKP